MDARKIQFLIGMQREIDKLEAQEGNTPKVERVKSRFYDVVEVEKMVGNGEIEQRQIPVDAGGDDTVTRDQSEEEKAIPSRLKTKEGWLDPRKGRVEDEFEAFEDNEGDTKINFSNGAIIRPKSRFNQVKFNTSEKSFPHKPKDVADFMKVFDDATGLKYLTHDFDDVEQKFEIHSFLTQAKSMFDLYTGKYIIPKSLWGVINQFAFQKTPEWYAIGEMVREGWSSQKWMEWSEKGGHPAKNREFEKSIQLFRDLTRIKSLPKIIDSAIEKKFGDKKNRFKFITVDLDKADFYTHVGRFIMALVHLFDEICHRPEFPNVTIRHDRQIVGDYRHRIISIHHHDSYPSNKSIEEVFEKYSQRGGHLWEVREKLFGYCDWHIETIWSEQPVRVHLLREGMKTNNTDVEIENLSSIALPGFTHTLTFYFR